MPKSSPGKRRKKETNKDDNSKQAKRVRRAKNDQANEKDEGENESNFEDANVDHSKSDDDPFSEQNFDIDHELDKNASKSNLSVFNVKSLIHHVLSDERVVAMACNIAEGKTDADDDDNENRKDKTKDETCSPSPGIIEPKLTRSRVRKVAETTGTAPDPLLLVKETIIHSPVKNVISPFKLKRKAPDTFNTHDEIDRTDEKEEDKDVNQEIEVPLADLTFSEGGSSDEEYDPLKEHVDGSEDDSESCVSSTSDLASPEPLRRTSRVKRRLLTDQISSPQPDDKKDENTALTTGPEELSSQFKVPLPISKSTDKKEIEETDLIAERTRSRLPLTDTSLESIEAQFIPPDQTPDLYDIINLDDLEQDDLDWHKWLFGLNAEKGATDTEDPEDSEYNFMAEDQKEEQEEYRTDRAVTISQKELAELFEEFLAEFGDEIPLTDERNSLQALEAPAVPYIEGVGMTLEQRACLITQLQKHTQLLVQVTLLSKERSDLSLITESCEGLLQDMIRLNDVSTSNYVTRLVDDKHATPTVFSSVKLSEALRVINLPRSSDTSTTTSPKPEDESRESTSGPVAKEVIKVIVSSPVFIYRELLPQVTFDAGKTTNTRAAFLQSEDNLLVLGLDQYGHNWSEIRKHYLPAKTTKQIKIRRKNLCSNRAPDNVVKQYNASHEIPSLPTVPAAPAPEAPRLILPAVVGAGASPALLKKSNSQQTITNGKKKLGRKRKNVKPATVKICKTTPHPKSEISKEIAANPFVPGVSNKVLPANLENVQHMKSGNVEQGTCPTSVHYPPIYGIPYENIPTIIVKDPVIKNTESLLISGRPPGVPFNVRLVEVSKNAPLEGINTQANGNNAGGNGSSTRTSVTSPNDRMRQILPNLKPLLRPAENMPVQTFQTVQRQSLNLNIPASTSTSLPSQILTSPHQQNIPIPASQTLPNQTTVVSFTQTLPTAQNQTLTQSSSTPTSQLVENQTSTSERSSPSEIAAEMTTDHASCTILQGSEKENIQPTSEETLGGSVDDGNREGLPTATSEDAKIRALSFAESYLNNVKREVKKDSLTYRSFLRVLADSKTNAWSPTRIYNEVAVVLKDFPDLVRDFVGFLEPHQALDAGEFMRNKDILKARAFLERVENHFSKNQSHFQKIIKAFSAFNSRESLSSEKEEKLYEAVVPLLKGQQYLIEEFNSFFKQLKPEQCHSDDFEEVDLGSGSEIEVDDFEELVIPDVKKNLTKTREFDKTPVKPTNRNISRKYRKLKKGDDNDKNAGEKDGDDLDEAIDNLGEVNDFPEDMEDNCDKVLESDEEDYDEAMDKINSDSETLENFTDTENITKYASDNSNPSTPASECKSVDDPFDEDYIDSPEASQESQITSASEAFSDWSSETIDMIAITNNSPGSLVQCQNSAASDEIKSKIVSIESQKNIAIPGSSKCGSEEKPEDSVQCAGDISQHQNVIPVNKSSNDVGKRISANNLDVDENGKSVIWTRDDDKKILQLFQTRGSSEGIYQDLAQQLQNKTAAQVESRFRVLLSLLSGGNNEHSSSDQSGSESEGESCDETVET